MSTVGRLSFVDFFPCRVGFLALVVLGPMLAATTAQPVPPPPPMDPNAASPDDLAAPANANIEVMTRGPVHEAYATPVNSGQTAGMIVAKQPANLIEELPPDVKPEGEGSAWIPGYWSWDDDRKDFIWVSGVWRVPPPGYRWMPGFWQEAQGQGFQWVSGYWMPAATEEAVYMPQPPQSVESGPSGPAPDENHFWVPGNWQWHETRYAWTPGYYAACQPDWIWTPSSYVWCPRGYVYVPGYWDYPLARRGLCYSPVYFNGPVSVYQPSVCLDVGVLSFSLFSRPSYSHYYFGDYYDDRYVSLGIRPWYYYQTARRGYDPLFSYYSWYHVNRMHEPMWEKNLVGWHDYYRVHPDMRPPHTFEAQQALLARPGSANRPDFRQLEFAQNARHMQSNPEAFVKLHPVSQVQRAELHNAVAQTRTFEKQRQQFEARPLVGGPGLAAGAAALHGPAQPEKVSYSKIQNFKSVQLPGAGANNLTPGIGRVGAANALGQGNATPSIGPAHQDRKTLGGLVPGTASVPAGASVPMNGNAALGATGPAGLTGATRANGGNNPSTAGANTFTPKTFTPPSSVNPARTGTGKGTPPGNGNNPKDKVDRSGRRAESTPAFTPAVKTFVEQPKAVKVDTPPMRVESFTPPKAQIQAYTPPKVPVQTFTPPKAQVQAYTPPPQTVQSYTPPKQTVQSFTPSTGGGGAAVRSFTPPPSRPQPPASTAPAGRNGNRGQDENKDKH